MFEILSFLPVPSCERGTNGPPVERWGIMMVEGTVEVVDIEKKSDRFIL